MKIASVIKNYANSKFLKIAFCASLVFSVIFGSAGVCADYSISAGTDMTQPDVSCTVWGLKDNVVTFSADKLEKKLGIDSGQLAGIIITDLPEKDVGQFSVCSENAVIYETINRDGLNRLTFTPAKGCSEADFCFVPLVPQEDQKYSKMTIALLDKPNIAPTATGDTIETQQNIAIQSSLKVTSDNLDNLKINVMEQPQKGELKFDGINYTYQPFLDMTGNDSFTFKAVDKYGCESTAAKVNIKINKPKTALTYADMKGNPNYYAAIKLAERGIIVGEKIGGGNFFFPKQTVTKGDFLVMLLAVTGKDSELQPAVNTGLDNDIAIPLWLKPYVTKAQRDGIISGKSFDFDSPVSKTEAVVMIENAAQIPDDQTTGQTFMDAGAIPSWAMQAYMNLYADRILTLDNGCVNPTANLNKGDTAGLLWNLLQYCDKNSGDIEMN